MTQEDKATQAQYAGPEYASGFTARPLVSTRNYMVSAANPLAVRAGVDIIEAGGNAVDAAIATQLVLGLVEPQSSGLGGGGYAILHQPGAGLYAYDGRETAPDSAGEQLFCADDGAPLPVLDAGRSGRSVGVPGLVMMLEKMHKAHGRLAWSRLFEAAIDMAEQGFLVSPRLHIQIREDLPQLLQPAIRAYLLTPAGDPWPVGHRLRNPALAQLMRRLAVQGAAPFHEGEIADGIIEAVGQAPYLPAVMTRRDFARYQALRVDSVAGTYRGFGIHGVAGSTSGGIAVLQALGILEHFDLGRQAPMDLESVHLLSQALRLAFADRNFHMGDPAFIQVPAARLLDKDYLRQRAALIDPLRDMGLAEPGRFDNPGAPRSSQENAVLPSTTHISIVDKEGQAIAMTSSVGLVFGSRLMSAGMILNDQLVAFSLAPRDAQGRLRANAPGPGKRPLSAIAPTLGFDAEGKLAFVTGSPGSSAIIPYVLKSIVGLIDWRLDAQEVLNLPNVVNRNGPTELEQGTRLEALAPELDRRGHDTLINPQTSGLHLIRKVPEGWQGGSDPRREGACMGA